MLKRNKIKELINAYQEDIINDIIELVNINTVINESPIDKENPFGTGVSKLFQKVSKWALKDKFNTKNIDNYAMDVSLGEKSNDYIGILVHADTVPADPTSFSFNPFKGKFDGEFIYGRGTQDDKGPLVGIYYAFKIIQDLNIPLKKEVRLIIGGNEETYHKGINKYFENNNYPISSFTADNEFPLINVELGGLVSKGFIPFKDKSIISFKGGEVVNAVAEFAEAEIITSRNVKSLLKKYSHENHLEFKIKSDKNKHLISLKGKPSHGSIPQKGISAITHLANFLLNFSDDKGLKFIVDKFHKKYYGEGFNLKIDQKNASIIGQTSTSLGKAVLKDGLLELDQDIRYSSFHSEEEIENKITNQYKNNQGFIEISKISKPLYIDENEPIVKILLNSYKEITGISDARPIISGGGTYAKNVPNCLAFGALFPGEEQRMHNIDERLNIESLKKAIEIYINAIINLANYKW
ncbi:MAG: Sapep family Mn(2+)-dependent dipeptidase [Mycoplasmatales bacterium]|nr:Sapep family Mn(2+)-dependent dipeptidase [Mycoplasmatales bacterium]